MAQTCDYLVIGGGAAGCIVAARLAASGAQVILVEAGPVDDMDTVLDLSRIAELWRDDSPLDWGYVAEPMARANPALKLDRAKVLGGCSSHNDCAFLRPPDSDFHAWEAAGAEGWGPQGVAPWFARVRERVHVDSYQGGNPVSEAFVQAARAHGFTDVELDREIRDGIGWFPLNSRGKQRQSSSVAYLHPLSALPPSLQLVTDTLVTGLHFDGDRVTGAASSSGDVHARCETVVCAGAFNSPQLLMLSGLGPGAELQALGITPRVDLPGVGRHLIDHVSATLRYELRDPIPPIAIQYFEACLLASTDNAAPAPELLYHFGLYGHADYATRAGYPHAQHSCTISPNVTRARSEGRVRLNSTDPAAAPVINPNYFSDADGYDERTLLEGMKLGREIAALAPLRELIVRELAPGADVVSDEALGEYMRTTCGTVYHSAGTCRMGDARERDTVVDPRLRVKGVQGLRVADASIFPAMVTVNICQTVMMCAEKAAAMILEDAR